MTTMKIDWVIAFDIYHKDEVLQYADTNTHFSISFDKKNTEVYLHIKGESDSFNCWLENAIQVISYDQNIDLLQKLEASIIHLYVPFHDENDVADLMLSAKSASTLSRLSTVLDIDYYSYFDVY